MSEKTVRVGVACWIFNPAGLVLMGKRLSTHGTGTWAPPGGKMEYGETPAACASRELFEETGISVPAEQFRYIGITNDIFPDNHYITIHYRADYITAAPTLREHNKCEKWQWFAPNALPDNLFLPIRNFIQNHSAICSRK